jgi:hypothetical protein
MKHESGRYQEEDEGAAYASSVSDEDLGLLEEEDYDYHRYRNDDAPDALHSFAIILNISDQVLT